MEVFAQDDERFRRWMESDAEAAEAKLIEATTAPGAWRAVGWKVSVLKLVGMYGMYGRIKVRLSVYRLPILD